jgi:hypothetical protein
MMTPSSHPKYHHHHHRTVLIINIMLVVMSSVTTDQPGLVLASRNGAGLPCLEEPSNHIIILILPPT